MLMSACVKDQGDPVEPGKGHGNKITFSIPGKSGGSQRAVDSNGNEDKIDSLAIFMFDATSKKLNNTFTSSDIQYADIPTGGMTATIEVTENVGSKVFFFVANPALAADLDNIRFNVTEIDEFQETISDSLPGLPGDQGASLLMSCKTTVADVERVTAAERKIGIRRRVARFDIDNMAVDPNDPSNANGTNFTIKKILLENINKQGYVFGDATGNAGIPLKKSNIAVPFGDGPGHNEGSTESAFFTYPCTIEAGKAGISFEGEFIG